jgi:recombination protein RecA
MPSLADIKRDMNRICPGSVIDGVEVKDVERIPLRAAALNRALHGGIPKGRMIELYGPEHSGKTTTALMIAAAYQQKDERPVVFIDAEGTYDALWATKIGVKHEAGKFIYWRPENLTAEQVFERTLQIADTGEAGLIILDSLPVLIPQQEDAKNMEQMTMGGIAAPLTKFTRKLGRILLRNSDVTFLGLNQVRDNMSGYGDPVTTPGGKAWKHMCSVRLVFKSENIDPNGIYLSESHPNPAGVRIWMQVKKNKTAPRDRKMGSYTLDFERGFDELQDVVMLAIIEGIVVTRGAGVSYVHNKETGEVLSALGKAKFMEKLRNCPEIFEKLKAEVLDADSRSEGAVNGNQSE